MSILKVQRRSIAQPQWPIGIDWSNPITQGSTASYVLRNGVPLGLNLVTGRSGLYRSGSGGDTSALWYVSVSSATNYDAFDLGQTLTSTPTPITVLVVGTQTSGVVSWSMLDRTQFNWYGWYGAQVDVVASTFNNSFDGSINTAGGLNPYVNQSHAVVFSQSAANDLKACGYGTSVTTDTSAAWPVSSSVSSIALGGSVRNGAMDNTSWAVFFLIHVWRRVLSDAEKISVCTNPWQLFAAPPLYLPLSAGGLIIRRIPHSVRTTQPRW